MVTAVRQIRAVERRITVAEEVVVGLARLEAMPKMALVVMVGNHQRAERLRVGWGAT
jgi:hypothetical protein